MNLNKQTSVAILARTLTKIPQLLHKHNKSSLGFQPREEKGKILGGKSSRLYWPFETFQLLEAVKDLVSPEALKLAEGFGQGFQIFRSKTSYLLD